MIDTELLKQYFPQLQWKVSTPEYNDHCKSLRHGASDAAIDRQRREVSSCYVGLEEKDDGFRRWECEFYLNDRDNFNAVQFGYDFSDQAECLNWLRSQVAKTANMLTLALVGDELIALPELQQRRDQIIEDAPKQTDAIISDFWHSWRDTPQELQLDPPSGYRLLAIDMNKVASHEGLYIACHFKFTPVPVRLLPDAKRYHAYALLYYGPIEQEPSDLRSRYEQMCGLIHPDALVFRGN
ncbi:MAG: hypothetical protein HC860_13940 [Alkalinema sp. RU_4_3]|nr:hypothetical protein [Alkalinema sp. RU_4_3]